MDNQLDLNDIMIQQAESIKQLLVLCANEGEADITISVYHSSGKTATAKLYDQAALVQSLYEALEYFQSEIS